MAIRTRLVEHFEASPDVAGDYGQAWLIEGLDFTVETQATGTTTIASWEIACLDCIGDASITPSPSEATPTVLASGNSASPTWSHEATGPSAYCLRIRAWSGAGQTGTLATEYREFHVGCTDLVDTEPCVLTTTAVRAAIEAQATAGEGRHDNFFGSNDRGWVGTAGRSGLSCLVALIRGLVDDVAALQIAVGPVSGLVSGLSTLAGRVTTVEGVASGAASTAATANSTANSAASAISVEVTAREAVTEYEAIDWTTTIDPQSTARAGFPADGVDENQVFTAAAGPFTHSASWSFLIQDGRLSPGRTISFVGIRAQSSPPAIEAGHNYRILFAVTGPNEIIASCRLEDPTDETPPTITGAEVTNADLDAIAITLSESCVGGLAGEFSLSGGPVDLTLGALTGTGASRSIALSRPVVPGESLGTIVWASSTIRDGSANYLADSSRSVTNSTAYPTFTSATINGTAFVATYGEAVTHSSSANLSLDVGGTPATLTYVSGSGTTQLTYTSSVEATQGQTVTFSASAPTGHASTATGLALQAVTAAEVTNNTAASAGLLWEDTFERAEGAVGGTWEVSVGTPGDVLTIVNESGQGNAYESVVAHTYHVWSTIPAGVTLPASYRATATIRHADRNNDYWGIVLKWASGTGIRVFCEYTGSIRLGPADSVGGNVSVTVTGGMPASWNTDQDHTLGAEYDAETGRVTIYVDDIEYGYGTLSVNQAATGTGVGVCGESTQKYWRSIRVEAVS